MTLNPLKIIRRTEPIECILVGNRATSIERIRLRKEGDYAKDFAKDRTYGPMRGARPVYDVNDKGKPVWIFDKETGAVLSLEQGEEVLKLLTDPELLNHLTDKEMIKNAIDLQPSFKVLILVALVSFLAGAMFLGPMIAG